MTNNDLFSIYLKGESVDNFNWGVRRPSLSHLEAGSSTSLSSASGFGQVKTFAQEGREDVRSRENRVEPRYKHSAKSQKTGKHNEHLASNKKDSILKESVSHSDNDSHRNISPVLRNLGTNRNSGVGAEESSDDEMGSVRFYKLFNKFKYQTILLPHSVTDK